MASPMSFTSPIYSLPPELLEETLIICAARGYPSAVAAFGRTCRHFNRLVYRPIDHRLWRETFLTTFDDPRPLIACIRGVETTGPIDNDADVVFDWAKEFMRRMDAVRMIRTHMELTPQTIDMFSTSQEIKDIPFSLREALETIVSVLDISPPFPAHQSEISAPSMKFPPVVIQHASELLQSDYTSQNTAWIDDLFKYGYPPLLVKQYLISGHQPSERLEAPDDIHACSEEGMLFHKLVFRKGFLPVPSFTPSIGPDPWAPLTDPELKCKASQSADEQYAAVREVARSKVYNLRYLRPERSWGPFLPAGDSPLLQRKNLGTPFPDFEQELSRYTLNAGTLAIDEAYSWEGDDGDYLPEEDETEDSDNDNDEDAGHYLQFVFGRPPVDSKFIGPKPHQVVPDYMFLAAARLLVESNIQDVSITGSAFELENANISLSKIVSALGCLDFGRLGSAPAFWDNSWVRPPLVPSRGIVAPKLDETPSRNGKGKQRAIPTSYEEVAGWDWAGVTGLWVRAICWLDYRDLLLHNLHGSTVDDISETMRLFPMTLRVRAYSKPPEPDPEELLREGTGMESLVWKLPVIHLEGESRGSDVVDDSHIVRRVRGTVRMLRDGAVRWSLTSSYPDEETPEWASEGVQIGSIGSAVGVLGMWTGAEHTTTDPLGPAWAWKIA